MHIHTTEMLHSGCENMLFITYRNKLKAYHIPKGRASQCRQKCRETHKMAALSKGHDGLRVRATKKHGPSMGQVKGGHKPTDSLKTLVYLV